MLSSFAVVLDSNAEYQAKTGREEASIDEELPGQAMSNGSGPEPAAEEQSAVLESANDIDEGTPRTGHYQTR